MGAESFQAAWAGLGAELRAQLPPGAAVLDAHTHLGLDEDGHTLSVQELVEYLDQVDPTARAVTFPLHDPDRDPAYRIPNDRVLAWAAETEGRVIPFCRLDPAQGPVAEAERCLARGARGIKLHPRAQAFGFDGPEVEAIFQVARDAGVPILIHAGRGMPSMASLARLALRYPEVGVVLAHGGIADQGIFATLLAEHPRVVYDTSCFPPDLIELAARVPAERIVFGSDVPYGRPVAGLFGTLRLAAYAGLDAGDRELLVGGTMMRLIDGEPLAPASDPRVPQVRPVVGRLTRLTSYLSMGFASTITGTTRDPSRALPSINLARAVCRDPDPGPVGEVLAKIDGLLAVAEETLSDGREDAFNGFALMMAANVVASTTPAAQPRE